MSKQVSGAAQAADKANQIWGDLVPVIAFVIVYNGMRLAGPETGLFGQENALFWATGVLILATAGIIAQKLFNRQKVPPFLVASSLIVGTFGIIGIALREEAFLYIKPTIQNLFLAGLIFGSMAVGQNIWKLMFKQVFDLPDFAWRQLAARWGLFFIAMALWNEYLWRTYAPIDKQAYDLGWLLVAPPEPYSVFGLQFGEKDAESVWANWKLGNMVIVFLFGALNVPYTLKHLRDGKEEAGEASAS